MYKVEYHLDSTRGVKRVLIAVTITRNKLFIANATLAEPPSDILLQKIRDIIDSFSVVL